MATVTFRPLTENFDIASVREALTFIWESSDTIDTVGTSELNTRYIGTEREDLKNAYISFYGDFSSENIDLWRVDRIVMGQGSQVVLELDDLVISGADIRNTITENLIPLFFSGNDTITTETEFPNTTVEGYWGNDTFIVPAQDHRVFASRGVDTVVFDFEFSAATITPELLFFLANGERTGFHIPSVQSPQGHEYHVFDTEILQFSDQFVAISEGFLEDDVLRGDQRRELTSHDVIVGNSGDDQIAGLNGLDTLFGGNGEDTIYGGSGRDYIDGGDGSDLLRGESDNDLIHGGDGNDQLQGDRGNDTLLGGTGIDVLLGGSGNDRILGEDGDDTVKGGHGSDTIAGGSGRDRIEGGGGSDSIHGGDGNDTISGQNGADILFGRLHNDRLLGGRGNDQMHGNHGNDTLLGGEGHDTLSGGSGNDTLLAGSGHDRLQGSSGNDRIAGQRGDDTLTGGRGDDIFVFNRGHGDDVITDFTAGDDHIRILNGADNLADLTFETQGADVLVSFADVSILVEDITLAALQDADNFLF